MGRLEGKKALVTGAAKRTGIGFAIAQKFASEGADVIVADLAKPIEGFQGYVRTSDAGDLENAARELGKFGVMAASVSVDITDPESIKAMAKVVAERFGKFDLLVNNAGGSPGTSTLLAMEEKAWFYNFDLNLHGAFRVIREVAPRLNDGASIINMASRAGKVPSAFLGAYCASKAALIMMTKVFALELSPRKIRVNAVCPGQIVTELGLWGWKLKAFAEKLSEEEYHKALADRLPLKKLGAPEDVANVVLFLASDESSYMTGQAINVTGGQLMEL